MDTHSVNSGFWAQVAQQFPDMIPSGGSVIKVKTDVSEKPTVKVLGVFETPDLTYVATEVAVLHGDVATAKVCRHETARTLDEILSLLSLSDAFEPVAA